MEFWGVEIKPGQTVKVEPGEGFVLHLSQATLGESKKGNVPVLLNLKVGEQKFVLGNLSHEKFPQLSFDLIFDDEFELSHNWKNGSVHFVGYKSMLPEEEEDIFSDEFDSDEEAPQLIPAGLTNGKPEKTADAKAKATKNASADVPKVGDNDSDEDDDDSDDDDSEDDDESDEDEENRVGSDEVMLDGESDDESESEDEDEDDSSEDDEEDEEETPKKVESGKKRPAEPATQTPASKKGKATPEKKDGKKAGQTATPHPAKQAKKTPGNKAPPQSPISNGKKSNKKAKHMGK